jgi:hypothetical protein
MRKSACPSQLKARGKTSATKTNDIYDENLANG